MKNITINLDRTDEKRQELSRLVSDVTEIMTIKIRLADGISVHLVEDLLQIGVHECHIALEIKRGSSCMFEAGFLCPRLLRREGCLYRLSNCCHRIVRTILIDHLEEGARSQTKIRFAGSNGRSLNLIAEQRHFASNTTSDFALSSVLSDGARLLCNTLITVHENLTGVTAISNNRNLLLGDQISVKVAPNLEVLSNMAICSHSSATGRVNTEELFYCASRGIDHDQTAQLLTNAFLYRTDTF